jgi:hypothetical protein
MIVLCLFFRNGKESPLITQIPPMKKKNEAYRFARHVSTTDKMLKLIERIN